MVNKRIVFAAGGSGGHVFPAVALCKQLNKQRVEIYCDQRSEKYIRETEKHIKFQTFFIEKPVGGIIQKLKFLYSIVKATVACMLDFLSDRPKVVVGFGGYPSIPVLIAASVLFIPIMLHQQDSVFGKVNYLFSFAAKRISLAFPATINLPMIVKFKTFHSGIIFRDDFLKIAAKKPGGKKFNILIIGGSQGAKSLSLPIVKALAFLEPDRQKKLKVVHQVREEYLDDAKKLYSQTKIENEVATFFPDIPHRLAAADLVVSRAGAGGIVEIMALGKPAILVPLPTSRDDHQFYNAKFLHDKGAAIMIEEQSFSPIEFINTIEQLIANADSRELIGERARKLFKNDALKIIIDEIKKI